MAKYTDITEALKKPQDVTHLEIRCDYGNKITEKILVCQNLKTLEIHGYSYEVPNSFKAFSQLEKVSFHGRYAYFPEFVFELPRLKHLYFEGYGMNNFPDKFDQLPQLESLKIIANFFSNPYLKFPYSIFNLPKLKWLHLHADMHQLSTSFYQLQQLEFLCLHYNNMHPATIDAICSFKQLKELHLSNYGYSGRPLYLPATIGCLSQLKQLAIHNNYIQELPTSLRNLHQLELLNVCNGRFTSLPFEEGDLPQLKALILEQNKQMQVVNELKKLVHTPLEHLDIKSCGLTAFPEIVFQFKKLKSLNLANNKIEQLPLEIANLQALMAIDTSKTPLAQTTEAKSGKPITKLLRLLRDTQSTAGFRKISLALLLNDFEYLQQVAPDEILPALNTPQNVVRENALVALEKHLPNQTDTLSEATSVVTIIGKNKGLPIHQTYQKLKQQGIRTARSLQDDTTHVVLGTEPGEKLAQAIDLGVIWVLPQHLRTYLQKVEVPYLMQFTSDQNTTDSLDDLLQNNDPQNVILGLTMMLEGGIPESLVYDVVILSFKKNYLPSTAAKKVLDRFTSEKFRAVLRKHSRKAMVNILWALQQEPLIDQKKLATAALKFFKNEPNRYYYFNTLQRTAFELCFKQGGEIADLAIKARIQQDTLELTGFYIKVVPEELRKFNDLKFINLGGNGLRKLPDWFIEFKSLEKLELTNNVFSKVEKNNLRRLLPDIKILF